MVNYTLFTNIIIYDLMDNNLCKLHFIWVFSESYTVIIKIWLADCHFELKLPNAFSAFHPAANTCQLKCLYRLLVAWQYGTQELVFGMIITDPEHWRLRLKWRDYHGIIAQRTPYKSHNAKRFVLVFEVIMQWVYCCLIPSNFSIGEMWEIYIIINSHLIVSLHGWCVLILSTLFR
jgi:hypothetical protein